VAKYPHVEDYRRSVQSLDEKQFVSMRFIALELRNHYVIRNIFFSINFLVYF
jgi:proteasome activator subunit 3 (PA28 gamma)